MPNYLIRFDRGGDELFEAANDAAATEYVRKLLLDEGAEDGDGGSLYLVKFVAEARLGDGEIEDECY